MFVVYLWLFLLLLLLRLILHIRVVCMIGFVRDIADVDEVSANVFLKAWIQLIIMFVLILNMSVICRRLFNMSISLL